MSDSPFLPQESMVTYIRLPKNLVAALDEVSKMEHRTRASQIRHILAEYVETNFVIEKKAAG